MTAAVDGGTPDEPDALVGAGAGADPDAAASPPNTCSPRSELRKIVRSLTSPRGAADGFGLRTCSTGCGCAASCSPELRAVPLYALPDEVGAGGTASREAPSPVEDALPHGFGKFVDGDGG